jgi:hypothetical protein
LQPKEVKVNCEYVSKYYGVPACIGRRVEVDGEPGIIAEDMGYYIGVLLDSDKPNNINPYHPTHKVKYLGMGNVRKMTKSQKRYRRFLRVGDCFETFGDFLRYESKHRECC